MPAEVRYFREIPDHPIIKWNNAYKLRNHDTVYYKDWVYLLYAESALRVFSFGYERSTPDKCITNRIDQTRYFIHYVVEGEGEYNGIPVKKGQGFTAWAGQKHSIVSNKENPMHFYWVDFYGKDAFDYMCELGFDLSTPIFNFDWIDKIKPIFQDVIYNDHEGADLCEYIYGCLRMLLSFHKNQNVRSKDKKLNQRESNVIKSANYIFRNAGLIKAEEVARFMNLSHKYLNRLFVQYKGCSLQSYIIDLRMSLAAKKLKDSDLMAKEIAIAAGYTDYAQFSKIFKKYYKVSPMEYRIMEQNKD